MTVQLSATSTRRFAARRFAAELNRAMRERGVGRRRLAQQLGMESASIIAHWRTGNGLPRLDSAIRLAECLEWDALVTIVRTARSSKCDQCGKAFVNEGGGPKRYCSERCRKVKAKVRLGSPTRVRADLAEREVDEHRVAVAGFCDGCEPEGVCHTPECALRPVSPLPLVVDLRPEPDIASPAPGPWGNLENTAVALLGIRAGNAKRWARPGEREAQSARTTEMHRRRAAP